MTDQEIRVGIDVGCKAHRVAIADLKGSMLEEFNISHTDAGFQEFFHRIEHHKQQLDLPVAVAMEGFNGYARPLDRLTRSVGMYPLVDDFGTFEWPRASDLKELITGRRV